MVAFFLSLGAALLWGLSDFYGGSESRRTSPISVLLVAKPFALLSALLLVLILRVDLVIDTSFLWAMAAGTFVLLGLAAYFYAMKIGKVSLIAPISTLGILVPVLFGAIRGELPGVISLLALPLALTGLLLISRQQDEEKKEVRLSSIFFALLAGLGFGLHMVCLDLAEISGPGWELAATQLGGVLTIVPIFFLSKKKPTVPPASSWSPLVFIGVADMIATAFFAIAASKGDLPLVSIGASMYPLVVIALAYLRLGERLLPLQLLGGGLVIAGAILLML